MTFLMDSVTDIITLPKKGQPTALPELKNYQPHQSFKQSHAESHLEQA